MKNEIYNWEGDILNWYDIVAIPVALIIIYFIAFLAIRKYKNTPIRKYFYSGLTVKLFGTFLHFGYHYFVFQGGDTFQYYLALSEVVTNFFAYPIDILESIFVSRENYSDLIRENILHKFYYTPEERQLIKFSFIFGLLGLNSYLGIGLFFSFFAFIGLWRIFKLFYLHFPKYHHFLALSVLFFPSIIFWASSISKDAITLGCLGILIYSIYNLFILRKNLITNFAVFLFSFILIGSIKGYIIVAIAPAVIVWIFFTYKNLIKNDQLRRLATPFFLIFIIVISVGGLAYLSSLPTFKQYLNPDVAKTAVTYYRYLSDGDRAGSTYSLGVIEPTFTGILRIVPNAIFVTLYRPYLWEVSNPAMLLAALESLLTLLVTLFLIFKYKLRIFKVISSHPILIFSLIFVLILSITTGITSGNFGSLMRYKMPCLPFYYLLLIVIFYHEKDSKSLNQKD